MRHDGGDKIMAQVLNCVSSHGLEAVLVAVELVIESGVLSTEHVLNVLARLNAAPVPESVESSLHLREAHPPLPHRGDGQRVLSVQAQHHGRQDAHQGQGKRPQRQRDCARNTGARRVVLSSDTALKTSERGKVKNQLLSTLIHGC